MDKANGLISENNDFETQAIPRDEKEVVDTLSKPIFGALPLKEVHCI